MSEVPGIPAEWPDPLVATTVFCALAGCLSLAWSFFVPVTEVLAALSAAALAARWAGRPLRRPLSAALVLAALGTLVGWAFFFSLPSALAILRAPGLSAAVVLVAYGGRPSPGIEGTG
jgi:hypothetical protein